jgi:hypothetical protein
MKLDSLKELVKNIRLDSLSVLTDFEHGKLWLAEKVIPEMEQLQSDNTALRQRVEELENSEDMSSGCFSMIEEALVACGEVMKAVPPMCYDDKIRSAVGKRNQRIKELEGEVATLNEFIKSIVPNHCDDECGMDCTCKRAKKILSTPTDSKPEKIQLLEADIAVAQWIKKSAESMAECLDCVPNMNIVTDALRYEEWFNKSKDALYSFRAAKAVFTTQTGSKLLAKVEAGEKLATYISDSISVSCKIHKDHYHGQCTCYEKFKLLSSYREACDERKTNE